MKLKREPKANYPVLNVCKEYSDEEHVLNDEDIQKYLIQDYKLNVGKSIVQESISQLLEAGVILHIAENGLYYDQRTFTYEDVKKHYIHIQKLSIAQSVKDGIIDRLTDELSVYQRDRLEEELAHERLSRPRITKGKA